MPKTSAFPLWGAGVFYAQMQSVINQEKAVENYRKSRFSVIFDLFLAKNYRKRSPQINKKQLQSDRSFKNRSFIMQI